MCSFKQLFYRNISRWVPLRGVVTQRSWGGALRDDTKNCCVAERFDGIFFSFVCPMTHMNSLKCY